MKSSFKERLAMQAVADGTISIREDGTIWKKNHRAEYECFGYLRLNIGSKYSGKRFTVMAHRVVWQYFFGDIPKADLTINHKDGCKTNNNPSNLELATLSENVRHRFDVLHHNGTRGESQRSSKFTDGEVLEIRRRMADGERNVDLAAEFKVDRNTIGRIRTRRSWLHI